jgi:UDP-N-acetyl-D-mannosaminuronate dehydrogenase
MKHNIELAVIGCGVVGGGILHTWHERGYRITAYDVNPETIARHRANGIAADSMDNFMNSTADMLFVAIATPQSEVDGSIFLDYMRSGLAVIGPWLKARVEAGHYPMVVMRSTMLPKLSEREIIPRLQEHSGLTAGIDFGYAHMPEILRETDANHDEANIWQVVIGALDERTADTLVKMLGAELGPERERLMSVVPVDVAEASKVIVNTFNATVISYFNQMWVLLEAMGINAQDAIDLARRMGEGSLNRWYGTAAGFPYGGKCLPKDVAATLALARGEQIDMPQLQGTRDVNDILVDFSEQGRVPAPVKGGFRRMSASQLREMALQALDQYEAAVNKKAAKAPETWRALDAQPAAQPAQPEPMTQDAMVAAIEHLSAAIDRLTGFMAPRLHETEPVVKRVPVRGQWLGVNGASEVLTNGSAIAGD